MFDIRYSRQAVKFLKSLDKTTVSRILTKIEKLKHDPISHDSKIVEGYSEKLLRVRVGDYRILDLAVFSIRAESRKRHSADCATLPISPAPAFDTYRFPQWRPFGSPGTKQDFHANLSVDIWSSKKFE